MKDVCGPDPQLAARYLTKLGVSAGPPDLETLNELHRAQVSRFAHDTVWMSRGRVPEAAHEALVDALLAGEGGGCVQLNFSFAWLLDQSGYDVDVHAARLQGAFDAEPDPDPYAHCVVTVALPEGVRWYADVGLGSALWEPVPLRAGRFEQGGGFSYTLAESATPGFDWQFHHDRRVRAARLVEFSTEPITLADMDEAYHFYASDPSSPLVQNITAHRRLGDRVLSLNGQVLTVRGEGRSTRVLRSAPEWEQVLREEFLLGLPGWTAEERARLWSKASGEVEPQDQVEVGADCGPGA